MFAPISFAGPQPFNDWFDPDTIQRNQLGLRIEAYDPYWGYGTFIYGKATATMEKGSLVQWDEVYNITDVPASLLSAGRSCGVLMVNMIANEFGWVQVAGFAPVSAAASVAADAAIGVSATAGQVGATGNGTQLVGVRNRFASTATVVKTNTQITTGSAILRTASGYDGWFLGMTLVSAGGIPASTVIARLDPDGRTVYMGSAVGVVDRLATATGSISATGNYTGYVGLLFNNPSTAPSFGT